ncbi:hypothetical protein SCALM49S_04465 [Streptomyces californicus]
MPLAPRHRADDLHQMVRGRVGPPDDPRHPALRRAHQLLFVDVPGHQHCAAGAGALDVAQHPQDFVVHRVDHQEHDLGRRLAAVLLDDADLGTGPQLTGHSGLGNRVLRA